MKVNAYLSYRKLFLGYSKYSDPLASKIRMRSCLHLIPLKDLVVLHLQISQGPSLETEFQRSIKFLRFVNIHTAYLKKIGLFDHLIFSLVKTAKFADTVP